MKKLLLLVPVSLLLAGCNIMPVKYEDGAHWALVENPLSEKCVDVSLEEGSIESIGLMSFFSGYQIQGTNLHYSSTLQGQCK